MTEIYYSGQKVHQMDITDKGIVIIRLVSNHHATEIGRLVID